MSGPTGSGKSTNSLALALEIGRTSEEVNYVYVLEPRAQGPYNEALENASLTTETLSRLIQAYSRSANRYVVIDSLTYVIPAMGATALGGQEDVTMKEGLRRSEILGVLSLDMMARKSSLTIIGTINSELFPRPTALEGACEGAFTIESLGRLILRDRSFRASQPILLESASVLAARSLLGQTATSGDTYFGQSLI
jgi:hypothetical protein